MTFFRREADRLDTYLDGHVTGRSIDPDDLDPALIETWTWATTAMAHTPSDPIAKSDTWRTIMQSSSAAPALSPAALEPARRTWALPVARDWSQWTVSLVAVGALLITLTAGVFGYERFVGGPPNEPTSIPAASFLAPGTPEATGCDVARRAPGAIETIMQSPPSQQPYFPRMGPNPVSEPIGATKGANAVDGTVMWMNSSPDEAVTGSIQRFMDTVYACRFYALDGDAIDMEGPFFSLFSDDFFRRELNGYADAGWPQQLTMWWQPGDPVEVVETRKLMDGNRYLVVLAEENYLGDSRVLSVAPTSDGGWLIDEVGWMTPVLNNGTPVIEIDDSTPIPAVDQATLALGLAISDIAAAAENPMVCGESNGTPIPCTTMVGINRVGPWWYNELPAETAFTLTFANTSDVATQVTSADLTLLGATAPGVDVTLDPGQQVDLIVQQAPGEVTIDFAQGDANTNAVLTFIPSDGQFTAG